MQIFDLFHRFVIFKTDLLHFLFHIFAIFLLWISFQRMIMNVPVTTNLAVFAVHTICLLTITIYCILENIYHKLEKLDLKVHEWKIRYNCAACRTANILLSPRLSDLVCRIRLFCRFVTRSRSLIQILLLIFTPPNPSLIFTPMSRRVTKSAIFFPLLHKGTRQVGQYLSLGCFT